MARNEAPTQSRKRSATATPRTYGTAPALDPSDKRWTSLSHREEGRVRNPSRLRDYAKFNRRRGIPLPGACLLLSLRAADAHALAAKMFGAPREGRCRRYADRVETGQDNAENRLLDDLSCCREGWDAVGGKAVA